MASPLIVNDNFIWYLKEAEPSAVYQSLAEIFNDPNQENPGNLADLVITFSPSIPSVNSFAGLIPQELNYLEDAKYIVYPDPPLGGDGTYQITATNSFGESATTTFSIEIAAEGNLLLTSTEISADGMQLTMQFSAVLETYPGTLSDVLYLTINGQIFPTSAINFNEKIVTYDFVSPVFSQQTVKLVYAATSQDGIPLVGVDGQLMNDTELTPQAPNGLPAAIDAPVLMACVVAPDGLSMFVATDTQLIADNWESYDVQPIEIYRGNNAHIVTSSLIYTTGLLVTIDPTTPITYGMEDLEIKITNYLFSRSILNGTTFTRVESQRYPITNNSELNDLPKNIYLTNNIIYDEEPQNSAVGKLSANDKDTADSENFVYSLVSGPNDADNDLFTIDRQFLVCKDPALAGIRDLRIQVQVDDTITTYTKGMTIYSKSTAETVIPVNGGKLQSLASSKKGLKSTLNLQKVAVVYNSNPGFLESEETARYYVEKRGLNEELLYGYDFGNDSANKDWFVESPTGPDNAALIMIQDFSLWAINNGVQGVVVSIKTPNRIRFNNGNRGIAHFVTTLGACHYVLKVNSLFTGSSGNPTPESLDSDISSVETDLQGTAYAKLIARAKNEDYWFDNTSTFEAQVSPYQTNFLPNRAYIPRMHNLRRLKSPLDPGGLLVMPCGRLGTHQGRGWVDSFANTKIIIDDAVEVENLGWEVNKLKQVNGMHRHRKNNMRGVTSGIIAAHLDRAGWNVKGTLYRPAVSPYLENNVHGEQYDSITKLKILYTMYNVPHMDYIAEDFREGKLDPPQPNFFSFGNMLTNDGDDVRGWENSFEWEKGSWHMVETSNPGATLARAMTAGAVGGMSGMIEPQSYNVKFYPGMIWAAAGGLSLMEGHWFTQQESFTGAFYLAGDPLYCPYKRIKSEKDPTIDESTSGDVVYPANLDIPQEIVFR